MLLTNAVNKCSEFYDIIEKEYGNKFDCQSDNCGINQKEELIRMLSDYKKDVYGHETLSITINSIKKLFKE